MTVRYYNEIRHRTEKNLLEKLHKPRRAHGRIYPRNFILVSVYHRKLEVCVSPTFIGVVKGRDNEGPLPLI